MSTAIQRDKSSFLYQQVVEMVMEMRSSGTLRAGDRLPSLRSFSQGLKVSIPTVRQAYVELERQGMVEARPKSGYFLKAQNIDVQGPKKATPPRRPRVVNKQSLIEEVFTAIHAPGSVALGLANPTAAHSSDKALARVMRRVLANAGNKAIAYGPMEGFPPLRRQLALSHIDQGLQIDPSEVLITNGAQEAIAIALKCVAKAGDIIAVESPTYFGVLELIESLGMMALEIPLCPDHGVGLADLEAALKKHPVKACVFSSSISNPLGSYMNDERREALVHLLESKDIPLIEDDVYGELHFQKTRSVLAQRFSTKGLVLTCSSFSKTAAPGYRIGWLLAGRFHDQAKRVKRALSCSSSLLNQWTLSEFMASGEYERNIRVLRQVLERYKQRAIALVTEYFPTETRMSNPQGGGVLWVELPSKNHGNDLFHRALDHNISIAPGTLFSPSDKFKHCIRVSYGVQWSDKIEESYRILGELVKEGSS
ncbi:PLP-dependent aminotransferase family protein [Arenicella sp. 4NH20-0111]|uniref:aminotransferase-like domain-containing protein n=1 Tax=Arenicella sp. 4NH20-0111 TaxID=3127648 RepID=UPI0033415427